MATRSDRSSPVAATAPRRSLRSVAGYSLAELLAVLAIMGIAAGVGVPIVADQMRQAKVRAAADQYAMSLKAARMLAVTQRPSGGLPVTIEVDPANRYRYLDNRGKVREFVMPDGVRIVSSTTPITFRSNGAVDSQATTVLEVTLSEDVTERWTVTTSVMGVTDVDRQRIEN